jgi:predicted CopG family antitoxin
MKTISLDEEAYKSLLEEKHEDESFSDVVKRLAGERSWLAVVGIWEDDAEEIETAISEGRERSRRTDDDYSVSN